MEKKKLLLVAVSVGVVLLIIIGIPLMMIVPKQKYASSVDSGQDWSAAIEPHNFQITQPAPEPIAEPQPAENFTRTETSPHVTTLTVPIPETVAVPNTPVAQAKKPSTVKLAPAPKAEATAPKAAPVKPAAKPAVTAKAPAAKPAADSKFNNYWIQTGAFSTQVRAEGAKDTLATKGITSIIDNRDIDGKTWYRVRVGPYISEKEANSWLALIKVMDGFGESQIRVTQAVQ